MRRLLRSFVVCALAGTTLLAQEGGAGTGWTPALELRVFSSLPEGATVNAAGDVTLVKAERVGKTVWTGASLCTVGMGSGDPDRTSSQVYNNIWKMTGEYLGEQAGRHQVRVTAGFTRLAGRDSSVTTTQTLSLREGDGVVLDALSAPLESGCPVHTVMLDARLVMRAADPALARVRYVADLWLVHTGPDGQERREHLVTNVDTLDAVPFAFNRLAFPVPEVDSRQGDIEATIQLTGSLRARARTDGLVDVDIETSRGIYGLDNPKRLLNRRRPTVQRTLTLKEGETTAIEFPPARGFAALALDPSGQVVVGARARQGTGTISITGTITGDGGSVAVDGKVLRLYPDRFFKGHRTQLLVRLRRLP